MLSVTVCSCNSRFKATFPEWLLSEADGRSQGRWEDCEVIMSQIQLFLCAHVLLEGNCFSLSLSLHICRSHSGELGATGLGSWEGPVDMGRLLSSEYEASPPGPGF